MKTLEPITFEAPAYWASYLINGDDSGLDDELERNKIDNWLAKNNLPMPASCSDNSFIGRFNGLQTELLEYTSLV
jgi:hypothetical protein